MTAYLTSRPSSGLSGRPRRAQCLIGSGIIPALKYLQRLPNCFATIAGSGNCGLPSTRFSGEVYRSSSSATGAQKLLDHLDRSLLPQAFRGDLVPQDPNDEPASALLERIRTERGVVKPSTKR